MIYYLNMKKLVLVVCISGTEIPEHDLYAKYLNIGM